MYPDINTSTRPYYIDIFLSLLRFPTPTRPRVLVGLVSTQGKKILKIVNDIKISEVADQIPEKILW